MSETAFEQLVISTLEQLQRGHEEIKHEIAAVGSTAERTLIQATKTNGRMDRAEEWQRNHAALHLEEDGDEEQALAFAAGAKSERDRAKSIAWRIWDEVRRYVYWGLAGGVALALAGVARALWVAPW